MSSMEHCVVHVVIVIKALLRQRTGGNVLHFLFFFPYLLLPDFIAMMSYCSRLLRFLFFYYSRFSLKSQEMTEAESFKCDFQLDTFFWLSLADECY